MSTKRLQASERRRQILDSALKIFAARGFKGTTTSAVAEAAGISEPILYRHFKNKLDLFHKLLEDVASRTLARWSTLIEKKPGSSVAAIERMARDLPAHLEAIRRENALLTRCIADAAEDASLRRILVDYYSGYALFLEGLLQDGVNEGSLRRNLDCQTAAWQLMGPGLAYSHTEGLRLDPKVKSKALRESVRALMKDWSA
ncbi:MAG: TetR/AcrR family transcriptional regulator [Planctomycetota bacterium]